MGRVVRVALAVAIGALVCGGCGANGAASDRAARPGDARDRSALPSVEQTAGRLGDATVDRSDGPPRELSHGGRPDVGRRGAVPPRDGVGAAAACPDPELAPAGETLPAIAEATLCLLNGERADHGLAPLAPNGRLAAAATAYAGDLVAGSYFSHTGRDGSGLLDRIERTGYVQGVAGWVLGENLAWGTGGLATPGSIMQAWMNSPGHRENILNAEFREVGIGVVAGNPAQADGQGATYATEFGAVEAGAAAAARHRDAPRAKRANRRGRHGAKARHARRRANARQARKRGGRAARRHAKHGASTRKRPASTARDRRSV